MEDLSLKIVMNGSSHHFWGMGWGWIIGLIITGVIIWIIVKAVNKTSPEVTKSDKSALDILKERYARGEIDREEFEERKKSITEK
ncbi:MAG: SHOCT domain-containing protein [Bacteroidota bacterium]